MASFVLSRARRLFSYSDLQGTSVDAMETGAGGSGSSSDHSGGGAAGLIPERLRSRKKCIGISTGIFATVVLFCIIASVHQSDDISLRTLPAAFSSASSGSGVGSVSDARRVKMSDTSQGKFYASHWNGTWINDEEFLFRDSEGNLYSASSMNIPFFFKLEFWKLLNFSITQILREIKVRATQMAKNGTFSSSKFSKNDFK